MAAARSKTARRTWSNSFVSNQLAASRSRVLRATGVRVASAAAPFAAAAAAESVCSPDGDATGVVVVVAAAAVAVTVLIRISPLVRALDPGAVPARAAVVAVSVSDESVRDGAP